MDAIISTTLGSWREHCWVLNFSFLIKGKLGNMIRSWMANEKIRICHVLYPYLLCYFLLSFDHILVLSLLSYVLSCFCQFLLPKLLQHSNHVVVFTSVLALFCFMFRYTWLFFLDPFSQSLLCHMYSPHLLKLVTPAAAAAAKSLQSCPTLCDPVDRSPPGRLRVGQSSGACGRREA